jgi:molybdenum cofactor cytidylyltransferase
VIAAILLAAGAARRFGSPKLLQELNGKAVVRWSVEALEGAPIDEIIVVVSPDSRGIRAALEGIDVRFVVNPHPELGVTGSIACGVSALGATTEAVLVALGDEPLVGRAALARVFDIYRASGAKIVAPTFEGVRGHPVLFDQSVFPELRMFSGDSGARNVVNREPARVALVEMGVPTPMDIDTPDDLARVRSQSASKRSLIDEWMPSFDVRATYSTEIKAPVETVYRAVLETDLARPFISRTLTAIRSFGRRTHVSLRFRDLPKRGSFFALADDPPYEVVCGVVGRFWAIKSSGMEADTASFRAPPPPGTAKAVLTFRVEPTATGSRLTTETRVLCADAASRLRFRLYWTLIGPFSGLMRKEALRLIRREAQYMSPSTSPRP